tara:strand:+ start:223 stop:1236 length:1014 start_codon:yes stop_codon:yes gene_type:complete
MAAEAFTALNRILESRERREQAERQMSLALMQFNYQKQQAQMAQTGKQLELLQGANAQMMTNVAGDFLSQSGLDVIYSDEDKGAKEAMESLEDLGLSKSDSARVASAVWAYYTAQNPQPVLRLGKSIKDIVIQGDAATRSQRNLVKGLGGSLGLTSTSPLEVERAKSLLDRTDKILQNQDDIMSEVYEYGAGDYEIQRTDIGLGLDKLADEREEALDAGAGVPIVSVPTPEEMVGQSKQSLKTAQSDLEETQNALNLLDTESMSLKELQRRGSLNDEQREYLSRIPEIKNDLESELTDLSEAVVEAKKEVGESRGFEAQTKLSKWMERDWERGYSPY